MKKGCCTKDTCGHNRDHDKSSDISQTPKNSGMANKETQMSPNVSVTSTEKTSMVTSSEYDVFYDCLKEKHKHPKLEMNQVYQQMEDPELFRGTLMQVTLLTQQLLKYFEQPTSMVPSKCKLCQNEQNFQYQSYPSHSQELVPWQKSDEHKCNDCQAIKSYNGPLAFTSSESVRMQIPWEVHLQSLYDKFKPRDFSKCTNPLCCDIAKAAEPYMKVAGIEPAPIKESSSTYYSCISTADQFSQTLTVPLFDIGYMPPCWCSLSNTHGLELLNKCPSTNYQKTCVPLKDENFMPPCWCLMENMEAELNSELLCECGLKPDQCICDKSKESLACAMAPLSQNAIPCSCDHEELAEDSKEELLCRCDLKPLLPVPSPPDVKIPLPLPPPKPPKKIYRMVFPQHKDLDICVKCRFEPSPLIDEDGNVICPGNCGCCLCPWKSRATNSMEGRLRHHKIKVCKCRDRCTIFTELNKADSACSQKSYFDICPCREKAEEKHILLYGTDMAKQLKLGDEVLLKDVKELIPAKQGSKRYFNSPMYHESKEK